jgi:hypothetical protein
MLIPNGRILQETPSPKPDCSRAKLKKDYEIIIIVNMSCLTGHAGLFLRGKEGVSGKRNLVYDPSGEYPEGLYRAEVAYFIAPKRVPTASPEEKQEYEREAKLASLENYLAFQRLDGPDIRQYSFRLTAEEEQKIRDKITGTFPEDGELTQDGKVVDTKGKTVGYDSLGEGLGPQCVIYVHHAIDDVGPFKVLPWSVRPGALADDLAKMVQMLSFCEAEA